MTANKSLKIGAIGSLACTYLLFVSAALAAPQISSISGELHHGQEVTISGNSFGAKSHARPLVWQNFETQGTSGLAVDNSPTLLGAVSSALTRARSGRALRWDISSSSNAGGLQTKFDSDRVYISLKRRYDFSVDNPANWGPIGLNLKVTRMWADAGGSNNIHLNYQGKDSKGVNSGRVTAERTGTGTLWLGGSVPQIKDRWLQEEFVYQAGSINTENGIFEYHRDGIKKWSARFRMRTSAWPDRYERLYFDQVSNGTGPGPLYVYYDDIYVDDSWHRVVLADAPVWSDTIRRELQIPTSWNNSSVTFQANLGDLPDASELYLYVIDGNGSASSGFLVSCDDCPKAPVLDVY